MSGRELREQKIKSVGYTTGDDEGGQYNGVYLAYWTDRDVGHPFDEMRAWQRLIEADEIVLVFSTILLERDDYHLNLRDQNGYLNEYSYTRATLPIALQLLADKNRPQAPVNEVVFHCKVSLKHLSEIWILAEDETIFSEKLQYLEKLVSSNVWKQIKPLIRPLRYHLPRLAYRNGCTDASLVAQVRAESCKPNFCSAYDGNATDNPEIIATLPTYQKIAANCGLSNSTICSVGTNVDALRQLIWQEEMKRLRDYNKYVTPPIYLPPFLPIPNQPKFCASPSS